MHAPPCLQALLHIQLQVFIKYTVWEGILTLKGFLSAETKDLAKRPPGLIVQPVFNLTSAGRSRTPEHTFQFTVLLPRCFEAPFVPSLASCLPRHLGVRWTHNAQHPTDGCSES